MPKSIKLRKNPELSTNIRTWRPLQDSQKFCLRTRRTNYCYVAFQGADWILIGLSIADQVILFLQNIESFLEAIKNLL